MERLHLDVNGIVQGVGFRPYIAVIARRNKLTGFVYNDENGVTIEVQGPVASIQNFIQSMYDEKPPLARIDTVKEIKMEIDPEEREFLIISSQENGDMTTLIAPDTAPCAACLQEMADVTNRRYAYPFINCTHCGPRYTLIQKVPYDRKYTSMGVFPMCTPCEEEYTDEMNRRYHAEPTCCEDCGPHYSLVGEEERFETYGKERDRYIIAAIRERLRNGEIGAIKGIGGYHLVCDATNEEAVQRLRALKHRPHKPLALMAGSMELVERLCYVSEAEKEVLLTPARPIVLLRQKENNGIAPSVAFTNENMGIMMPYSPFHAMLLEADDLVVMTSANRHNEPLIYSEDEALAYLGAMSDFIVINNREIVAPLDDSLSRVVNDKNLLLRRSRGYVPMPIPMAESAELSILAAGSDLKNTFALVKKKDVFVGPHIGDLENEKTFSHFLKNLERMKSLFTVEPQALVCDLHPNYRSSIWARKEAQEKELPLIEVQHHHAHIAAVVAEHHLTGPVMGIALDGTGYGTDGTVWGGEILRVDGADCTRIAHLEYAPLPGGEAAVKEPWRQALWYLRTIYGQEIPAVFEKWMETLPKNWQMLDQIMANPAFTMPQTSSMGRLFDAVGSLLGLGNIHHFESEISMALESLASDVAGEVLPYSIRKGEECIEISFIPTIKAICNGIIEGRDSAFLAASFHETVCHAFMEVAIAEATREKIEHIALGGGVFQNKKILQGCISRESNQSVYYNHEVPPNDGGLSLGQAYIGKMILTKGGK